MTNADLIPLSDLSIPQINKVLDKLHLYAPEQYNAEERLGLLQCSKLYRRLLSRYEFDSVLACFNKGQFIDFKTSDDEINGIFPKKTGRNVILYPCVVCANEVTDEADNTGYGLHCSGCEHYFHNSCNDHPISVELYNHLKNSPTYVKTFCRNCNVAMNNTSIRLKRLDMKVSEVKSDIVSLKEGISGDNVSSYSAMLKNGSNNQTAESKLANSLTKKLAAQQKASNAEETEERNKRTILIRRPLDPGITNSKGLRSSFNKEFPGIVIKNCRITAGGSFKLELDKEEEVKVIADQ